MTVAILTSQQSDPALDRRSESDFSYRWFSGTGAGGQHRNKKQCCLELTHLPTGLSQIANGRSRDTNAAEAMAKLTAKLDELKSSGSHEQTNDVRARQIGLGMRGDKRRTYRFQEDAVQDHLTGKRASCRHFMRGDIEKLW